jgi:hypothetical protein
MPLPHVWNNPMQTWFSRNGDSVPPVKASPEVEAELLDTRTPSGRGEHETQDLNAGDGASRELSLLNHAHQAIAQVQGLDEIKNIRDKAEAVRKYAQSVGMGLELQNYAAEVKLRAERKAGELLAQMQLHGGDRKSAESGSSSEARRHRDQQRSVVTLAANRSGVGSGLSRSTSPRRKPTVAK